MNINHLICLLLLVGIATQKGIVQNLPNNFEPKDEGEYLTYLNLMIGNHVESAVMTENIQTIANELRPSILNAPEKVVLLLTTGIEQTLQNQDLPVSISTSDLKELIESHHQLFEIQVLLSADKAKIAEEINKHQSKGALVNTISGQEKDILEMGKAFTQTIVSARRRLQESQAPTTDGTYLIKFFFSILFVLVIVGTVGFISQNDGKKDTLLYAKFIADVGGR